MKGESSKNGEGGQPSIERIDEDFFTPPLAPEMERNGLAVNS